MKSRYIFRWLLAGGLLILFVPFLGVHQLIVSPSDYVSGAYGVGHASITGPARRVLIRFLGLSVERWDKARNSPLVYAAFYENDEGVDEIVSKVSCVHLSLSLNKIESEGFRRHSVASIRRELMRRCSALPVDTKRTSA